MLMLTLATKLMQAKITLTDLGGRMVLLQSRQLQEPGMRLELEESAVLGVVRLLFSRLVVPHLHRRSDEGGRGRAKASLSRLLQTQRDRQLHVRRVGIFHRDMRRALQSR